MKPIIIDLYCGGGGMSMGYYLAGFNVIGVDIYKQPKYPFKFYQCDAIDFIKNYSGSYDAVSASPPCQLFTKAARSSTKKHINLIPDTRGALKQTGKPWVIENVPDSPLIDPIMLCGLSFGLKTYRHRIFESNFYIKEPPHLKHIFPNAKMGRPPKAGQFIQVVGHFSGVKFAQQAMGIDWLGQKELAQAIPPAYSKYIAEYIKLKI